ncbi:hypothetical protein EQV77_03435 [Halobacillus fulvus]|nr:hypothetical protein EQV77_03435 [Halobacillus fulvus]
MKKRIPLLTVIVSISAVLLTRKKVKAPTAAASTGRIPAGSLLFSPIGKRESKYVGHVGIVTEDQHVIHSVPAGIIKDPLKLYEQKFRLIERYAPHDLSAGIKAAEFADHLHQTYPRALYRIRTPLDAKPSEQYCTKIVWQAYKEGAGLNIRALPSKSMAVHPYLLKSSRLFKRVSSD